MYGSILTIVSAFVTIAITTAASAQCPPRCVAPRVVQKPQVMPAPPSSPPSAYTPYNPQMQVMPAPPSNPPSAYTPSSYPPGPPVYSSPSQSVYTPPGQSPSYFPSGPQGYTPSNPPPTPPQYPPTAYILPTVVCVIPALGSCIVNGQASSGDTCWCSSINGPVWGNVQ
jgi:hypothetical protein